MAKQSGLHQIKGKIGEFSYYRQSGVNSGLIRGINPAMSNRVKTDEAYANTRLNNREFGQACEIAGALGKMVTPKFRAMILPFSQSKMAKALLQQIKLDPTADIPWGFRGLGVDPFVAPVDVLNVLAKRSFDDFANNIEFTATSTSSGGYNLSAAVSLSNDINEHVTSIGAHGVYFKFIAAEVIYRRPDSESQENAICWSVNRANDTNEWILGDSNFTETLSVPPQIPVSGYERSQVIVVLAMPFRLVGETANILQEYCSFKAYNITVGA